MTAHSPMVPCRETWSAAVERPEAFLGIRAVCEADLPEILVIYNHAVVNTTATFDVMPRSADAQQAWFLEHAPPHPAIVWEQEGRILGWASLSPYASRCAYRFAGEASVYVAPESRRSGVGEGLLREIIRLGADYGLHTVVGLVTEENAASCALAEKVGFRRVGMLEEVGYKFDRWLNVILYQYRYGS
jgi:L-amino acid N-acyltransferase YncA